MNLIRGVDHLLIGVRDLEAARKTWQRLGFCITPRGRHIGWGTANYCIMFEDGYLELLGIVDPAQFTNKLDRFLEKREGLMGLAFAAEDIEALAQEFTQRGIKADGPRALKRILELPDGDAEPAFELLFLDGAATAGLSAFVCCHLTRRLVWQAPWIEHPNGAIGIESCTAIAEDPVEAASRLLHLPGAQGRGAKAVAFGSTDIVFMNSDDAKKSFPSLPDHPKPWLAAARILVNRLEVTRDLLQRAGLPVEQGAGMLRLAPLSANGLWLEFVAPAGS